MAVLKIPPESFPNEQMRAALAAVWEKSLPLLRQRVTVLEQAVEQMRQGALQEALHEEAAREAHRMAGLLGTFGYPEGTDAARLLELALDTQHATAPETSPSTEEFFASLQAATAVLREIVGE